MLNSLLQILESVHESTKLNNLQSEKELLLRLAKNIVNVLLLIDRAYLKKNLSSQNSTVESRPSDYPLDFFNTDDPFSIKFQLQGSASESSIQLPSVASYASLLLTPDQESALEYISEFLRTLDESKDLLQLPENRVIVEYLNISPSQPNLSENLIKALMDGMDKDKHSQIVEALCDIVLPLLKLTTRGEVDDTLYLRQTISYLVIHGFHSVNATNRGRFNDFLRAVAADPLVTNETFNAFPLYVLTHLFIETGRASAPSPEMLQVYTKEIIEAVKKGNVLFLLLLFVQNNIELNKVVVNERGLISASINNDIFWILEYALLDALKKWLTQNAGQPITESEINDLQKSIQEKIFYPLILIIKEQCPWFALEAIKNGLNKTLSSYPVNWLYNFVQKTQISTSQVSFLRRRSTVRPLATVVADRMRELENKLIKCKQERETSSTRLLGAYKSFLSDCYIKRIITINAYYHLHLKEHELRTQNLNSLILRDMAMGVDPMMADNVCLRVNEALMVEPIPTNGATGEQELIPPWFKEHVLVSSTEEIRDTQEFFTDAQKDLYIPQWFVDHVLSVFINPLSIHYQLET